MTQFICIACKKTKTFTSIDYLEAHIAETHYSFLPYSCMLCEYGGRFPTEMAIITHMRNCHQIDEDEFKFYTIFNKETPEKRKKIADMLQRCMGMGPREENNDKCTHNQRPNGGNDLPQEASVIKSNENTTSNVQKAYQPPPPPLPSIPQKKKSPEAEKPSTTNQNGFTASTPTIKEPAEIINPKPAKIPRLPNPTITTSSGKRVQKEKKSNEKKVSDTATKGGYNGVNIEHLFEETKPNHNANENQDEEHNEDDNKEKEGLPKVSKGIPQNDFELPSAFFGTKQSSTLGLALYKAESEGRDYQARMARGQIQDDEGLDEFLKRQNQLASKRTDHNEFCKLKQEIDENLGKSRQQLTEERNKDVKLKKEDRERKKNDDRSENGKRHSSNKGDGSGGKRQRIEDSKLPKSDGSAIDVEN